MSESCSKNIYKSTGCDDISVGNGNITLEACGDRLGTFSLDQCHDQTIEIPCGEEPCDGALNFSVNGELAFTFTANQCTDTDFNLDLNALGVGDVDWSEFPICDDCIKWCGPDGKPKGILKDFKVGTAKQSPIRTARASQTRRLKLIKFWSSSCGICHRMSHYDSKVAKELGIEFIAIHKDEDDLWDEWVHVAEPLYEDTDGMGWPTYILVNHYDESNFTTIGEVLGGSDKGKFRRKIQELLEPLPTPEPKDERAFPSEEGTGGEVSMRCTPKEGCDEFVWDCSCEGAHICEGVNGRLSFKVTTHGCDGRCHEAGGGQQLDYKWKWSDDKSNWRNLDGQPANGECNFNLSDIGRQNMKAGEKLWLMAIATCPDHPDKDQRRLEGGGGSNGGQYITVEIIECCGPDGKICKNGRKCCNKQDHPDQPEGCKDCCTNPNCPGDQVCIDGKCQDPPLEHECDSNADCGACQDCAEGSGGVRKCKNRECPNGQKCCADVDGCRECCNNNDCTGGKLCENYKCVDPPLDHECNENKDCGPCKDCTTGSGGLRKCTNRVCPDGQKCCDDVDGCRECCNDNDCPGDQECKNGKCQDPPLEHECNENKDCGPCKDCTTGAQGLRKCTNRQCPEGQKCCDDVDGCRECCTNNDCPEGWECGPSGNCQAPHECDSNEDCGACKDCVEGLGGVRKCKNRVCPDGQMCCPEVDGCRECCINTDCGPGQICNNNYKCEDNPNQSGCEKNEDCVGDCEKCVDGKCQVVCPDGQKCCPGVGCRECCNDTHCADDEKCNDNYNCVPDGGTTPPPTDPCEGVNCDASKCLVCENGVCVSICPPGKICDGNGNCIDRPNECGDDLEVGYTCPGPGEAGSTVTLTATDNKGGQGVRFEWYIGSLAEADQVSTGREYVYTYPASGTCERVILYATWDSGNCGDLDWMECSICGTGGGGPTPTPDCTNDDDCPGDDQCCQGDGSCGPCGTPPPTPDCTNDDDCPADQCCQGDGSCGPCDPTPPPTNGDCDNGQCKNSWWIDWDCVAGKLNQRNRDLVLRLERRIEMLESKLKES